MKLIFNAIAITCILSFITGCSTTPKMHVSKIVNVNLVTQDSTPEYMYLSNKITGESVGGVGIFENTIYYTLLSGKYLKVADGNDGTYYRHIDKGLKFKNMGITEHKQGGFKMPNSTSGEWRLWYTPNEMFIVPIGTGVPLFVSTGTTKSDFVEAIKIKSITPYLTANEN